MAKNTTLKTRIQNRHDTEANWTTASNATKPFIPLKGEVIVYDPDTTHTTPRVKIGDGVTKVGNLAFVGSDISKYVTTDINQTISGNKLFLNPIQVGGSSNLEDYTKITSTDITVRAGEDASWYKVGNDKFSHGDTTNTYTATLPNKSGTVALTSDIPSVPSSILTYDYTFDTTGKKLSYPIMIAKNPSLSASMTRIDEGSITFRDLSRNNYEGTTQLVVAQVNNNDPVVVSLPSTSGELALKSDIPSTDNYVTTDTAQTISGVKTFTGAIQLQGVGIAAKVGGENSSYTNILKGSGNVVEVGSTSYLTRIYSNGRISVYDYSTSPSTSEKVAYQSEIPTNYVTTDTEQTISAIKTFNSRVYIVKANGTGSIDLQPEGIIDMLGGGMYTFKIDATKKQMTVGAMGTNTVLHFNPNSNTVEVPNKSGTIALTEDVNKKLTKPTGNPTKDSIVVVDSSGNVSYKALSDLASQSASDIRSVIY